MRSNSSNACLSNNKIRKRIGSMSMQSRRSFFRHSSAGLVLCGVNVLKLPAATQPTDSAGSAEAYNAAFKGFSALEAPSNWEASEESADEALFRRNAPFRGKVTPPG